MLFERDLALSLFDRLDGLINEIVQVLSLVPHELE
jgi:hypothetical protein